MNPRNIPTGYCASRLYPVRRHTTEVQIGKVRIGATHPIAIQSMTTTPTEDVDATVSQARSLAEAGCEIIRITAPTLKAARALADIRKRLSADGFDQPLVADIHFLPKAALESAEHVEKVRINPGNYTDTKRFKVKTYSESDYQEALQKLYEEVSPLIIRCKELGRALRIGTNHGSLSDRIMNRFGDTPEGMVESALEIVRIAESHGYRNLVLSLKASNPKVMIAAYRLAAARMAAENMHYPLHLGVTEAGDGEDARVKSFVGMGSLLADGLGDTLRVSLTEDPECEVPVARELANWAHRLWANTTATTPWTERGFDPFHPGRRPVERIHLSDAIVLDAANPPMVAVRAPSPLDPKALSQSIAAIQMRNKDAPIEWLVVDGTDAATLPALNILSEALAGAIHGIILDSIPDGLSLMDCITGEMRSQLSWIVNLPMSGLIEKGPELLAGLPLKGITLSIDWNGCPIDESSVDSILSITDSQPFLITTAAIPSDLTPVGYHRLLVEAFAKKGSHPPLWIRNRDSDENPEESALLLHSILTGTLLCDGFGNIVSIEGDQPLKETLPRISTLLQGARSRISKTEFVACPSCGRTLFDLQSTTQRIRAKTGHLKGVTIAIMGCIVNGPGEMADADFGYVGGAPGKVNLYVGKTCVKTGIPETDAVDHLIDLIRQHGRWSDPEPAIPEAS